MDKSLDGPHSWSGQHGGRKVESCCPYQLVAVANLFGYSGSYSLNGLLLLLSLLLLITNLEVWGPKTGHHQSSPDNPWHQTQALTVTTWILSLGKSGSKQDQYTARGWGSEGWNRVINVSQRDESPRILTSMKLMWNIYCTMQEPLLTIH